MRYLRYTLVGLLLLCLVIVALANRDPVTLHLIPVVLFAYVPGEPAIDLPLFVVIFASVLFGLVLGFAWEWVREHRHRAAAARAQREAQRLAREVEKSGKAKPKDDVLALLE